MLMLQCYYHNVIYIDVTLLLSRSHICRCHSVIVTMSYMLMSHCYCHNVISVDVTFLLSQGQLCQCHIIIVTRSYLLMSQCFLLLTLDHLSIYHLIVTPLECCHQAVLYFSPSSPAAAVTGWFLLLPLPRQPFVACSLAQNTICHECI